MRNYKEICCFVNQHEVLSEREKELCRAYVEYNTQAQLAAHLKIAVKTVKFHLTKIYDKLNVENGKHLFRYLVGLVN